MTTDPTFFRDGYTRRFRIAALPGLHGELSGELRPMLTTQRDRLRAIFREETSDKANAAIFDAIAKQLVKWNASDEKGNAVDVSRETVARLPPLLNDRLFAILIGNDPGDPLTEMSDDEASDFIKILEGSNAGESAAKNSSAGAGS